MVAVVWDDYTIGCPDEYIGKCTEACPSLRCVQALRVRYQADGCRARMRSAVRDWDGCNLVATVALSLLKTRFSLSRLNLNGSRDSLLTPCSRSFARSFLRFGKDFGPAQRCTLRFLPCDISSWFSSDPAGVIASVWRALIDCYGCGLRIFGAAGDPR